MAQQPKSPQNEAALKEAQDLARAAREHEAAARAKEQEYQQELQQEGPER